MRKVLFLLFLLPLFAVAQDKGIKFEHGLSWKEIQAKAKAENKYIFIDCFTTWCGPCKYMTANVFPQQEVGDFFNSKFINVKLQMDVTPGDNEEVKKWYEDAKAIGEQYSVRAYPTFLFFSPDGKVAHRMVGGGEAEPFIARAKESLEPEKQYYAQLTKYEQGNRDQAFLRKFAESALAAYDAKTAQAVSTEYFNTQKDLFTKENLELLAKFTRTSKDKGFTIFLNEGAKANKILGEGKSEGIVSGIISNEEIYPKIFKKDAGAPDWNVLQSDLAAKYPALADEMIAKSKVIYYSNMKDAENSVNSIVAYMKKYSHKASPLDLNQFAWAIFENCKDMKCVEDALAWSKRSFSENQDPNFMDTYANLLYKLGRKEEAISWQEKAVGLSKDKKALQETLDKMKKGEKTWN
ncbi:thioredoxin fold domain-containing protein [Chitinophaga sp. SYP-B3965]|uniref:thioredoxin family protein n=1 Tax=Chitinophaga sp. SYP-B3965 TaxID=2663120 RepID=UPI0012998301|nr:thioredoxin fold domain-containing protein [Chitinophaga sp. SYP-B3965]MRG47421.1 thioredoxin fold domain-containing protein [Chitinophaga sp. SYP-B3965]